MPFIVPFTWSATRQACSAPRGRALQPQLHTLPRHGGSAQGNAAPAPTKGSVRATPSRGPIGVEHHQPLAPRSAPYSREPRRCTVAVPGWRSPGARRRVRAAGRDRAGPVTMQGVAAHGRAPSPRISLSARRPGRRDTAALPPTEESVRAVPSRGPTIAAHPQYHTPRSAPCSREPRRCMVAVPG